VESVDILFLVRHYTETPTIELEKTVRLRRRFSPMVK
jgi:hypothetical protein